MIPVSRHTITLPLSQGKIFMYTFITINVDNQHMILL